MHLYTIFHISLNVFIYINVYICIYRKQYANSRYKHILIGQYDNKGQPSQYSPHGVHPGSPGYPHSPIYPDNRQGMKYSHI